MVHKAILIAEMAMILRVGLAAFLAREFPGFAILEVTSREALEKASREVSPDLVVIGQGLKGASRIEDLARYKRDFPHQAAVVSGDHADIGDAVALIEAGMLGLIPRTLSEQQLKHAFETVLSGHIFLPGNSARPASRKPAAVPGVDPTLAFTGRQEEVLQLLARGYSNKEIARELDIAENTVKVHLQATFRQLGVHSRARAIAKLNTRTPHAGSALQGSLPFPDRRHSGT